MDGLWGGCEALESVSIWSNSHFTPWLSILSITFSTSPRVSCDTPGSYSLNSPTHVYIYKKAALGTESSLLTINSFSILCPLHSNTLSSSVMLWQTWWSAPRCTDSIYGYVVLASLSRIPTGPSGRSQGACKQTLDATLGSYSGVRMTRIKSCVPENNPKVSVELGQGVKITSEHVSFAWVVPRGC